ncbi:MAG: hypothetical protein AVDCRST_MAG56-2709 [uncultured Cytophagales bacterium]|uniref:Rhs-family protein n=1 Tax=uncultured Cytophagales bacterium TaxID=158755 RepID=A0A6J4IW30_9SPHI|nr:MAG: hypothetical protein AVDCRST_MAG56-2709 [uncultured Cytophagales bacterium]
MEGTGGRSFSFLFDTKDKLINAEVTYPKGESKYPRRTFSIERNNEYQIARVINDFYDTLNKRANTVVYTYEYDNAGKLTSFYVNTNAVDRFMLTFDDNQRLTKIAYPGGGYETSEFNNKGNLVKYSKKYSNSDVVHSLEYTKYDDKKNVFNGITEFIFEFHYFVYSANNPLTLTANANDAKQNFINYTYTYNEKDYPVTSTSVNTSIYPTISPITQNAAYQYNCK